MTHQHGSGITELTAEQSTRLGFPRLVETWRLELALAIMNPSAYSVALAQADITELHRTFGLIDVAIQNAADIVAYTQMGKHELRFRELLSDLHGRCMVEAAHRGVTLMPWPTAGSFQ